MKKTLKDVLVICNLDNALMTPAQEILSCNVEMVRLFCTLGGRFTIATARTLSSTKEVVKDLCINAPVAVCGGGMVVDWESEQVLQKHCLDSQTALQLIQDVQSRFPDTGIEIVDDMGKVLVLQSSAYTNEHIIRENLECIYQPLEDMQSPWTKIVFTDSSKMLQRISAFVADRNYFQLQPVFTNHIYYEIMPEKATKGNALKTICQKIDFPLENTVAIGDYYNDMELLKTAGYAVAMGNAPSEVKLIADQVTDDCQDGGVASYLYHLIKHYA